MKKPEQPASPFSDLRPDASPDKPKPRVSPDVRIMNEGLRRIAPPRANRLERKANREAAIRELAKFWKTVQAWCLNISKDFPAVRIRTLEDRIKEKIKADNPQLDRRARRQPLSKLIPYLKRFDWRDYYIVPDVRDQGDCGSCWACVATEVFESSAMIARANFDIPINVDFRPDPVWVDVRYTLNRVTDCAGCFSGWPQIAFKHYVDSGIPSAETMISYTHPEDDNLSFDKNYQDKGAPRIKAVAWDYVLWWTPGRVPAPIRLKKALLEYGPLAVALIRDESFRNYGVEDNKGSTVAPVYPSVFDPKNTGTIPDHFVLLIGWDDEKRAWIIQNSAGRNWGYSCQDGFEVIDGKRQEDRGYMYIRWGGNDIGRYAAWVQAELLEKGMLAQFRRELHSPE